jgi:HEAT repeat protein
MRKFTLTALLLSVLSSASAVPQALEDSSALVSFAEKLKQKGVSLDRDSLLAALHSSDHEVRSLAASQLAEQRVAEALPGIRRAYREETRPLLRVNLAYALSWLEPVEGSQLLKASCSDNELGAMAQLRAASYLVRSKNATCFPSVLKIIRESPESGERAAGLFLLPHFAAAGGVTCGEVESLVLLRLRSDSAHERSAATTALASVCKSSAIGHLQEAVRREQDSDLRAKMERELKNLQEQKPRQ